MMGKKSRVIAVILVMITLLVGMVWTHFVYAKVLELVIELITEVGVTIAESQI